MKNIILKTLVASMLISGLASCGDDWLNLTDPNQETAYTYWKTAEQFNQGLTAAYSTWRRPGFFSRWFQVLTVIKSDEGWSNSPNPEFIGDASFVWIHTIMTATKASTCLGNRCITACIT